MIVNPEKFQVIITDKKEQNNNPIEKKCWKYSSIVRVKTMQ